jgi:hypothetical protein
MPPLTRLFIKTALAYLALALLAGLARSLPPSEALPVFFAYLTPVYFHLFMAGWVLQLIIGVGYWMFPKHTREQPRGNEALAWAAYGLLNAGLALRVVAEPLHAMQPHPAWGWALALSAVLQWLGGMAFVANAWPRIKEH